MLALPQNLEAYGISFWAQVIFINLFSSPVYQDGVLYFIIEELPNPRDSGLFKILCGSAQIALDAVTLYEPVGLLLPISSSA